MFFDFSFWLHQGRIPHRMCRFYCCLAAHQRTRKKDSAEPSFPILWTPPHPPGGIRCGGALLLPRAWGNLGICIPVLSLLPSSEYGLAVCVRASIVRVSVGLLGLYRLFFIIGGWTVRSCGYVWFCFFFRRITADRAISSNFVGCKPISPMLPGAKRLKKMRSCSLYCKKTGFPYSLSL